MARGRDVHRLDEDDVRVRANPRGTRPRSKHRPAHTDAAEGMVLTVDRGRYGVLVDGTIVTAMRARELGRKGIAVGDRVSVVGEVSGGADALVRIVRLAERTTVLRRTADDDDPLERVIVANADQLVIVAALADPEPSFGLIDRCIVAALTAGMEPLLCLTKADLAAPDALLAIYAPLGVPYVVTRKEDPPDALRDRLAGHLSVLVGHSGVGKSTLVNALVPAAARAVSEVNPVTGRGRHTSSSAIAFELPSGDGWIIDTPGVRGFGLAHVPPEAIVAAFTDLAAGAVSCPPHCTHLGPDCALDAWVAEGHAAPSRLESLRRLIAGREGVGGD